MGTSLRVFLATTIVSTCVQAFAQAANPVDGDSIVYVVHISVDGLRPDAVTVLGPELVPNFYRLRTEGAFTDNARTDIDYTNTLPNHAAMMTGRRVLTPEGHGVTFNDDHPGTFASVHGSYVAGVFDVAHDRGLRTAHFYSKDKFDFYSRSWDADHGAPDTIGVDNGTAKIDTDVFRDDTAELTGLWLEGMQADPWHYSFIHFRDPDTFGHARQWMSAGYLDAVVTVDGYLGQILDLIDTDSTFSGRTAIVLTSDHGGSGTHHVTAGEPLHFVIPVYVWGPGVDPGADLYELNWDTRRPYCMAEPGGAAPAQPVRNGDTGNLALALLGLPAIPGSTINSSQDLKLSFSQNALPPVVSLELPGSNERYRTGDTIVLYSEAAGGSAAVESVSFEVACDTVDVVSEPPFATEWSLGAPGTHVVKATVFDEVGRFSSDTVSIVIEPGITVNGSDADWLALDVTPVLDTDRLQQDPELALNRLFFYEDSVSYYFAFDAGAQSKRVAYGLYLDLDAFRRTQQNEPLGHAVRASNRHAPEVIFYFEHDEVNGWTDESPSFHVWDPNTGNWSGPGWGSSASFSADTSLGFVEFSFAKSLGMSETTEGIFAALFSVGETEGAGASDSIPSDEGVAHAEENSSTETTVLSTFHNFTFPAFPGDAIRIDGNRFDWLRAPIPPIENTDGVQTDPELALDRLFVTHDLDNMYFAFIATPGPKQVTYGLYIDSGAFIDPSAGEGGPGSANGNAIEVANFLPDLQIYFDNDTTGTFTDDTPRYYIWDDLAKSWTTLSDEGAGLPEGAAFGTNVFGTSSFVELSIPRAAPGLYDSESLLIELFSAGSVPGAGASATIPADPNVMFTTENTSTDVTVLSSPYSYTTRPFVVGTEAPGELPAAIQLFQNYPNPVSSETTVSFSVDRSQHVRLAVYDMLGRLQTVVHDGFAGPGTQRVLFDAGALASGTYFLRLEGSGASATRKMMVVR